MPILTHICMMQISSTTNQKIKNIKKLDKHKERMEQGRFVIEGMRELCLADRAGYVIEELYICMPLLKETASYTLASCQLQDTSQYEITEEVYRSIAYRDTTEGIIALAHTREHSLAGLVLPAQPLILVIEGVEKPGNLGAMMRTCDAAGVDAVIVCDARTDIYNPNVIRSSIGTVFTTPVAIARSTEAIAYLKGKQITTYAAALADSIDYLSSQLSHATAIIVGTEADGLSTTWIQGAAHRIRIPMLGKIDSLNVSVSTAILLYEAVRQRGGIR
jgi:RNA methyltransferase, TrmH family